jgi:hypothetical protein
LKRRRRRSNIFKMNITKAISTPQEKGKAFENIDPDQLDAIQQRICLENALEPSSGISLGFDHDDVKKLHNAKLFDDIPQNDVRAGISGQTIIDPRQIYSIATQARMFFYPKAVEPSEKNKLMILLIASGENEQTIVEMRVDPTKFKKAVESSLLKPLKSESAS